MDKVQPNEIRLVVDGGIIQTVGLGKDVPRDILITLTDFDLDGQTPQDDPRIEDSGYGKLAFCQIIHEPGDEIDKDSVDEDQTAWL